MSRVLEDRAQWDDLITDMYKDVFPEFPLGIQWEEKTGRMLSYISALAPNGQIVNVVIPITKDERNLDPAGLAHIKRKLTGHKAAFIASLHHKLLTYSQMTPIPANLSRMIYEGRGHGSKKE